MIKAIFESLAEGLKLTNFIARRRAAKNDNPEVKQSRWNAEVNREVTKKDGVGATVRINDALARLRMRRANTKPADGSGGKVPKE